MKLYPSLNVSISCQNLGGKNYLIILKGEEQQINLVHNSIYNLNGTNSKELVWETHYHDLATLSSTESQIRNYFKNLLMNRLRNSKDRGSILSFKNVRKYLKTNVEKLANQLFETHSILKSYYQISLTNKNHEGNY